MADALFDLDLLDEEDSFEIDAQAAHLFKHPRLGPFSALIERRA